MILPTTRPEKMGMGLVGDLDLLLFLKAGYGTPRWHGFLTRLPIPPTANYSEVVLSRTQLVFSKHPSCYHSQTNDAAYK